MPASVPATSNESTAPVEVTQILPAALDACWDLWTTNKGLQACLVEASNVELRIGGPYEWYFMMDAPAGSRGSEQCTILSYRPRHMLSFTWNAPPQFEHARFRHTWVVVTLDAVDDMHTRVTLTHHGWAEQMVAHPDHADEWMQVRKYFTAAWPSVLTTMEQHLSAR